MTSISLQDTVREKLIPWARPDADRLLLARLKEKELRFPEAVSVSSAPALGRKQSVRGRKVYNHHIVMERWPREGQETLRVPMLWSVVSGSLKLRLGEYYLDLPSGYTVLIPSGVPHPSGWKYDFPNPHCDVFIMSPRGRQMQCWLTEHRHGQVKQTQNVSVLNTSLVDDLDRIVDEMSRDHRNATQVAGHLLSVIWLALERELQQQRYVEILPAASNVQKPRMHDPIFVARQYIQSHLHEELTLGGVARAVHLSRTQFVVLFRQDTGQSFVEYLTARRLEWACQLLRETGWTVSHICTFVGFKAPPYFHRLFRRKIGMTPIQYRQTDIEYDSIKTPEKS